MGTIGGNIANGSPIGDTPPPLIALGATLTLRKGSERRDHSARGFLHRLWQAGPRSPANSSRRCMFRCRPRATHFAVYKITKRRDEDITAALGAFHLTLGDGRHGRLTIRIAYGGMAATPKRATAVEAALVGKPWTEATVEAAMAALCARTSRR